MQFDLQDVVPLPLEGFVDAQSQVWQTQCRISANERTVVSATSGKGKSTLIGLLYGLRKDYTGAIMLDGNSFAAPTPIALAELRQRRLSIVFQDLRLFLHETALNNLLIKGHLAQSEAEEIARAMATELGIEQLLNKPCGVLSYGERQRVAIVRAMLQPFDLLLLDEPFSHLDEANTARAIGLIERRCRENGAGWLLATLGPSYFDTLDRILIL